MEKIITVNPEVEKFLSELFPTTGPVLKEMEEEARRLDFPIVGPVVGRLLALFIKIGGYKIVLELGSGFGYSAYWMASALPKEKGKIYCTDYEENNRKMAEEFLKKANLWQKCEFWVGDALDFAIQMDRKVDLIFNDIEKVFYPDVPTLAERLLNPGGLLISDNAFWFGKVFQTSGQDEDTLGIQRYLKMVTKNEHFETTIVPLRDGIIVSRYKG